MMSPAWSRPPSFLSLPDDLRKRIYLFAGLFRECPITIAPSLRAISARRLSFTSQECVFQLRKEKRTFYSIRKGPDCICPDLPKQLLLVCRGIHKEVQALLYGENKFVISAHRHADDLRVFMTLPIDGIRSLRHLLIRLTSWPCLRGHSSSDPELDSCSNGHTYANDLKIFSVGNPSQSVLNQWTQICGLLSNVMPGTLHLEIICDTSDLATARQVTEPAMRLLPPLRECSIRLGRKMDYSLRSLAESSVLALTRGIKKVKSLPVEKSTAPVSLFSSLPRELRLHILSFTNLTPCGSFLEGLEDIEIVDGKYNHPANEEYDTSAIRACCLDCSFTKTHCFCALNFSSYGSNGSCSCRVLPLELFLVDRQMYLDATEIFYSSNLFDFDGPFDITENMLKALPIQALRQIRRIGLNVGSTSAYGRYRLEPEWRSLLSFINSSFNTSQLCIEINMTGDLDEVITDPGDTLEALEDVYDGYIGIVRGIKKEVFGLLDFHLYLGVLFDLEPVLEKYIMGQDYDSLNGNRYSKARNASEYFSDEQKIFLRVPPWHKEL